MWPLLHGTEDGTPTPIRGFASVLCRPATLGGVCTQLRLFARGLPRIVSLLSPRRVVGVLRRHTSGSARATQEEPRPRTDHRATQAQLLGLRDQPSAQGAGNAAKRHCGARGSGRGGLCTLTAPARRGASRPDRPQCTSRCQCRGLRAQPVRVHHPDRRVVPVHCRSGAPRRRCAGKGRQAAGLADDPGRACAASLAGAQAVGDRTQEPRHGARGRRGARAVLRAQRHTEEELSVGILLAHYPTKVSRLLALWHAQLTGENLFAGQSLNLDFHSVPYFGEHPLVESHYLSKRSRRQPSILAFLAQDADSQVFCYSNADIRKGEEADEIFRFIDFWKRQYGKAPQHLVFDSKLTTYQGLDRLDAAGIIFLTLRRRSPSLLTEVDHLPPSAWRTVTLDLPHRKYRNPRVYEQKACPRQRSYRQFFITDLGHDEPTILLTNDTSSTAKTLIARYAKRMLIENALADAVRFFHIDALSSSVGFKVDFDIALLVLASTLYRLMARRMRGYDDAQARQIFRDLIDMPADVAITENEIRVRFHRRAHLPIVLASGLFDRPIPVPWWFGRSLRLVQ